MCSFVTPLSTSSSFDGSPPLIPSAAAIGSPTMPVPGIPTPKPFFMMLPLRAISALSTGLPKSFAEVAAASATAIGSVQPSAGTTSLLKASM